MTELPPAYTGCPHEYCPNDCEGYCAEAREHRAGRWCVVCMDPITDEQDLTFAPDGCTAHPGCWAMATPRQLAGHSVEVCPTCGGLPTERRDCDLGDCLGSPHMVPCGDSWHDAMAEAS